MDLEVDLATKWEKFRRDLIGSGVQLLYRLDELKWTRGDKFGQLTVKNVYNAIATKLWKKNNWRLEEKIVAMGLSTKN
jgi:hypothetical protein